MSETPHGERGFLQLVVPKLILFFYPISGDTPVPKQAASRSLTRNPDAKSMFNSSRPDLDLPTAKPMTISSLKPLQHHD